jgi:tRNA pseudouridine55 synthase
MPSHDPSGLLVIDKPSGPTSHDVVSRVRRALGMRSVGHAGTLDPMASGVLLVMVGECTKLSPYLALEDKSYRATVRLGEATDTHDALGRVTARGPVPDEVRAALERLERGERVGGPLEHALELERTRALQRPPEHSAVKIAGEPAYRRARRGEAVRLAPRPVAMTGLRLVGASAATGELELELTVSKGYYVRAMARDLGDALGVPAHLGSLRRTRCGPFAIGEAVALDQPAEVLRVAIVPTSQAARRAMASAVLTAEGVRRALCGQRLSDGDFEQPPPDGTSCWLASDGSVVAIGERAGGHPRVVRAFSRSAQVC